MQSKMKYAWDIVLEKNLSEQELQLVSEISKMISSGCNVNEVKTKIKELNLNPE